MQNIDFYRKKNIRSTPAQAEIYEPEFFHEIQDHDPRINQHSFKENERNRKRASRLIFFISALCIMSFTTGLVIGIKFAGGAEREIVDKKTFHAVTDIGKKVSNLINERSEEKDANKKIFPKNSYPYVIKVNNLYAHTHSLAMANYLSKKGHTVILSKSGKNYKIYIGPFKTEKDASIAMNKISTYHKYTLANNIRVIKR